MASSIRLSTSFTLLLAIICGSGAGCAPEEGGRPSKAERIEAELTSVRAALMECRSFELSETIHAAVKSTLASPCNPALGGCFDLGDWSPLRAELLYYERWRPSEKGGDPAKVKRPVDPVPIVKAYADALAARGVDLLVVPVPTRVQVYPDRLPGVPAIGEYRGFDVGHLQVLHDLLVAGVEVLDLLPHFFSQRHDTSGENDPLLYQDFDVHWTPRGAALCADVISQRIRQFDWFEPGPCREGVDFVVHHESGLGHSGAIPFGEERPRQWYECVRDHNGEPAPVTGDQTPLLLLGDSFSMVFADPRGSDLVRLIHARLGYPIDAILVPGGGVNAVWQSLARRSEGVSGRRLVLWILSARALGSGRMEAVDLFPAD